MRSAALYDESGDSIVAIIVRDDETGIDESIDIVRKVVVEGYEFSMDCDGDYEIDMDVEVFYRDGLSEDAHV